LLVFGQRLRKTYGFCKKDSTKCHALKNVESKTTFKNGE
jgi:hypothetical protein